ncbi:MAG: hypothetical protein KGS72_12625 [Cyanobacteria bacterium REEB67]|nr:hypothetical protein [Cyanobacteria bacterium REEB67]
MDMPWTDVSTEAVDFYQQGNYRQALTGFGEGEKLARASQATPLELSEVLHNLSIAQFALSLFARGAPRGFLRFDCRLAPS